jgi:hypothetical protein
MNQGALSFSCMYGCLIGLMWIVGSALVGLAISYLSHQIVR